MPELSVFIDDGGVLNDNSIRSQEWQRGVAEFFSPRLGGEPDAWREANRIRGMNLWNEMPPEPNESYESWYDRYQIAWLRGMAEHVGVHAPPDDEALFLAKDAARYITLNCKSGFPDAAPAIRTLAETGVALHTASGEDSREIDGYLTSMGVRQHFSELYGPDLTGMFKRGPEYYEAAFARSKLDARGCLVVDDSPEALAWAAAAGALTVLVVRKALVPAIDGRMVIRDLAGLPGLIQGLIRS